MLKIPYKLVDGIMLVSVTANGKEGFFAFDTGAMETAVNRAYFPEMQGERVETRYAGLKVSWDTGNRRDPKLYRSA